MNAAGGNGTILRVLALVAPAGVPVFGVNLGRLTLGEIDAAAGRRLRYAKYLDGLTTAAERHRGHGLRVDAPSRVQR